MYAPQTGGAYGDAGADQMAGVKYAEGAAAQNKRIVILSLGGHPGSFTALQASVIKLLTGYCTRQELLFRALTAIGYRL